MTERQSINIIEESQPNIPVCRIETHKQRVATKAGIPAFAGEPIGRLTNEDMRLYGFALHRNSGLPKEDARRTFKEVRRRFQEGDEVEQARLSHIVRSAIEGLRGKTSSQELSPVAQPVIVFDSRRS